MAAHRRDYQGIDLRIRRTATGITGTELARLGGVKQPNYSGMETGKRRVPPGLVRDTLARVESAVAAIARRLQATPPDADGVIVLTVYDTDVDFATNWPDFAWLPTTAHQQAVGRTASALEAQGHPVRIQAHAAAQTSVPVEQ